MNSEVTRILRGGKKNNIETCQKRINTVSWQEKTLQE
jgi:hypothetical protein